MTGLTCRGCGTCGTCALLPLDMLDLIHTSHRISPEVHSTALRCAGMWLATKTSGGKHIHTEPTPKPGRAWTCGHPRIPENIRVHTVKGELCRLCDNQASTARYHRAKLRREHAITV